MWALIELTRAIGGHVCIMCACIYGLARSLASDLLHHQFNLHIIGGISHCKRDLFVIISSLDVPTYGVYNQFYDSQCSAEGLSLYFCFVARLARYLHK